LNLDLFDDRPGGDGPEPSPEAETPEAEAAEPSPDALDPTLQTEAPRAEGSGAAPEVGGEERPDPEGPTVWSVTEVNRAVRALLERTIPAVWVRGEVANWTRARSGHRYFTLKDEDSQIDCVLWRSNAHRLPTDPEEGMKVRAYGSVTLYEARGRYQLVVERVMGEEGEGLWRLAFEKLKRALEEEGLLAPERKRSLPSFPERIGVVTSTTGAALRDIVSVVERRAPWTRIVVRGSRVQGDGAAEEIARAIGDLARWGEVDVIIAGRGGGSIEDLWAFNEEVVARAIAACPVPVVSAVGHEVDVTIADLVADRRAPTPSAGAEAVVPDRAGLQEIVEGMRPRLVRGLRGALELRGRAVTEAKERLERSLLALVEPRRRRVEAAREALGRAVRRVIEGRRHRLSGVAGRVEALSPLSTLQRGYAVPLSDEGTVLRRVEEFSPGLPFRLRVVDGRVGCRVRPEEAKGGPDA